MTTTTAETVDPTLESVSRLRAIRDESWKALGGAQGTITAATQGLAKAEKAYRLADDTYYTARRTAQEEGLVAP